MNENPPPASPTPRLEVDDVIVVDKKRVRTAIGGTVVGNFMEWFDFGIYGYLAVTLSVVLWRLSGLITFWSAALCPVLVACLSTDLRCRSGFVLCTADCFVWCRSRFSP